MLASLLEPPVPLRSVLGSPVSIVAALAIAGVDVLETTFLLIVASGRERDQAGDGDPR